MRGDRQLQHAQPLTFAQRGNQHDLRVGKLQRIVMRVRIVHVDLSEPNDFLPELYVLEQTKTFKSNRREEYVKMPGKMARPNLDHRSELPEVLAAVRTSLPSCRKAGKTPTFMPVR